MPPCSSASPPAIGRWPVSHKRSRCLFFSGSAKSSYSVRACRIVEFLSNWMSPGTQVHLEVERPDRTRSSSMRSMSSDAAPRSSAAPGRGAVSRGCTSRCRRSAVRTVDLEAERELEERRFSRRPVRRCGRTQNGAKSNGHQVRTAAQDLVEHRNRAGDAAQCRRSRRAQAHADPMMSAPSVWKPRVSRVLYRRSDGSRRSSSEVIARARAESPAAFCEIARTEMRCESPVGQRRSHRLVALDRHSAHEKKAAARCQLGGPTVDARTQTVRSLEREVRGRDLDEWLAGGARRRERALQLGSISHREPVDPVVPKRLP
jgi:hypothetical protein